MEKKTTHTQMLPFEKCMTYGFEALSDAELLAIIIRSGTKKSDCMTTAKNVIEHTCDKSLIGLQKMTVNDLCKINGLGRVKAVQLKSICELSRRMAIQSHEKAPVFSDSSAVAEYCMESMRHLEKEHVRALLLDTKNTLLRDETLSIGTGDYAPLSTREICALALRYNTSNVILVHNHPSGDATPSEDDIKSTIAVKNGLDIIGIRLIDHIIIGDNIFVSMKYEQLF